MVDFKSYKEVKLIDIADIERAKKGKMYDAGCVIIQVSATDGQIYVLSEVQEVETKYAVIIPKESINGYYLKVAIERELLKFLHQNQTGMNLQMDSFKALKIKLHNRETQDYLEQILKKYDDGLEKEREIIDELKDMKKYYLANMFC